MVCLIRSIHLLLTEFWLGRASVCGHLNLVPPLLSLLNDPTTKSSGQLQLILTAQQKVSLSWCSVTVLRCWRPLLTHQIMTFVLLPSTCSSSANHTSSCRVMNMKATLKDHMMFKRSQPAHSCITRPHHCKTWCHKTAANSQPGEGWSCWKVIRAVSTKLWPVHDTGCWHQHAK